MVGREITKKHEEFTRGQLSDVRERFEIDDPRGEITLVMAGADLMAEWDEESVRGIISERLAQGMRRSEAARQVAAETGWPRNEVYRMAEEAE